MNILIIDDNDMTRNLLRTIVGHSGHRIVGEAGSTKQGVEMALALKPDLVFLDILMPDGSGIDVLKRITKDLPETVVLMVTGKRDDETTAECMANGAKGIVVKPFKVDKILQAIAESSNKTRDDSWKKIQLKNSRSAGFLTRFRPANFKIRTRLSAGFGVALLLTLLISFAGNWGLHYSSIASDKMVNETFVKERLLTEWRTSTELNGARTEAIANNADPKFADSLTAKISETSSRISEVQKKLETMPRSSAEAALYDEVAQKRKAYQTAREEVLAAVKNGNVDETKKLADTNLQPALAAYLASIKAVSDLQMNEIADSTKEVAEIFSNNKIGLNVLTVLAALISVGFALLISRSITDPLQAAIDISKAVSTGDLTTSAINVNGKDELSELLWGLKHMNENLGVLVGQVRASADSIAVTAGHITTGSNNLATRTEQQASSLEETAAAMEELTSTVKQNTDNVRQANGLAESASTVAVKGGEVVTQVVSTMESINESSKKIADIIGVIDGIAFQTNILALNAAVEAARAGEQGRGFAVVASEVRNLAQRSASAAREIKTLIDDSVDKVRMGSVLVSRAGSTMGEIVTSIKNVTDIMAEITTAGLEQTAGIEQISASIIQLDKTTQQNSHLVENSLEASNSLEQKANDMIGVVQVFRLDSTEPVGQTGSNTRSLQLAEPRGTAKEAIALVERALEFRKKVTSRDAFFKAITDRANKFFDRDMYVFVLDGQGKYVAFGGNPAKMGSRLQDVPGVDGEKLMRDIIAQCEYGPGWVDYDIFNAVTNKVQSKRSYVQEIDGYYIGCGIYTSLS